MVTNDAATHKASSWIGCSQLGLFLHAQNVQWHGGAVFKHNVIFFTVVYTVLFTAEQ